MWLFGAPGTALGVALLLQPVLIQPRDAPSAEEIAAEDIGFRISGFTSFIGGVQPIVMLQGVVVVRTGDSRWPAIACIKVKLSSIETRMCWMVFLIKP